MISNRVRDAVAYKDQGTVLSNFVANIVTYANSTVLDFSFQFCSILSSDISLETSFQDISNDMSHDRIGQERNEIFQTVEFT